MQWNEDKLATRGIITIMGYAAIAAVVRAAFKPLWYDELYTLALARQLRPSAVWDALRHAVDTFPPTFYVAERVACLVVPGERIALRLLSVLAFCCATLCVFIFVRRRSGGTCALICAALLMLSTLYDPYAVEARGYTLSAAGLAVALVSYQRVSSIWWAALMALSLACAEAFHYYAVFAFLPFAVAEVFYAWEMQRLRRRVWLALACGVVPLALFWPLLLSVKHVYGGDFWAPATLARLAGFYGWVFQMPVSLGVALTLVAALCLIGTGWFGRPLLREDGKSSADPPDSPFYEAVLVLGLIALPCVLFVVAKVTHSGFANRYSFPALLGFPIAASHVLNRLDRKVVVLFGVFVLFSVAVQEALFWVPLRHQWSEDLSPAAGVEELVNAAGHSQLAVVVSGGTEFLQIAHYASPEWRKRFVCLVDPGEAKVYAGTDNVDKDLLVLSSYVSLPVYAFDEFAVNHAEFLLYSSGDGRWDWWPAWLVDSGYALKLVSSNPGHKAKVYLVSANDKVKLTSKSGGTR
jgi:hypothetical protein